MDFQERFQLVKRNTEEILTEEELGTLLKQKNYPIKEGMYRPFIPKWANAFGPKKVWLSEAWDFFFNKECLQSKNYPEKLDFSEGVPINFRL